MSVELVQVTADNVDQLGFFCKKSKRRTAGWQAKRAWHDEVGDGVQTWIALDGKRQVGFVEFATAESTWRVVDAPGHLVVHCLWVVGRAKEQGTGGRLLQIVREAAEAEGLGVAALTSTKKGWLLGSGLLERAGFEQVGAAPPCFELWATPAAGQPTPTLPDDWDARAAAFGEGLTLVSTHQCPYVDLLREGLGKAAERHGLAFRDVHLQTATEVRARAPSAYGVVSVVRDGRLVAWRYEADSVLDRTLSQPEG